MTQNTQPVTSNLNKVKFDKIFIIDINPGNDPISKELVMGKIARVIKNASIYQNIIILSHSNMDLLKKLVKDIGIKNGFIVSDYGARIYDIAHNKMIYENSIGKDDVGAVAHYAMMQNLLVLASSSGKEFAYSLNLLNAAMLAKKHYTPLSFTNDYNKFTKFTNSSTIHSLLIFHKDRSEMEKALLLFNKILEE
jgi:hydroxymethylpyrimidine pyrophosphatase-like HAD family hydrolase